MSFPYRSDMGARLRTSVGHVARVDAYPAGAAPFSLAVEDLVVDFDESWSPRARAVMTVPVPEDPAQARGLDGRRAARLKVSLGYAEEGAPPEVKLAADLVLQSADPAQPGHQLTLQAVGDEILAQEDIYRATDGTAPTTGVVEFVSWLIRKAVAPYAPTITAPGVSDLWRPWAVVGVLSEGMTYWEAIEEVALRVGLYVYAEGPRDWVITLRSRLNTAPVAVLRTGPRGTITSLGERVERRAWYNAVFLRYRWRDQFGSPQELVANKSAISGLFNVNTVGRKTLLRDRAMPATREQADAAATELLAASLTRGTSYAIDAAAAYWVRPRQTVTLRLTSGQVRTVIVSRVTFRPLVGLMTITTASMSDITTPEG